MTNCPNCGAPYKLNSRVCEYCGTVREQAKVSHDDAILIDVGSSFRDLGGAIEPYICHKWAYISGAMPDQSQQAACGVQALANAASHNIATCSFEQMRLNAETGRIGAFPHTPLTIEHRRKKLLKSAFSIQFYTWLACLLGLTLILPNASFLCYCLAGKPSIVAKVLGRLLLPLLVSLSYVIALRGLKRAYRGC